MKKISSWPTKANNMVIRTQKKCNWNNAIIYRAITCTAVSRNRNMPSKVNVNWLSVVDCRRLCMASRKREGLLRSFTFELENLLQWSIASGINDWLKALLERCNRCMVKELDDAELDGGGRSIYFHQVYLILFLRNNWKHVLSWSPTYSAGAWWSARLYYSGPTPYSRTEHAWQNPCVYI